MASRDGRRIFEGVSGAPIVLRPATPPMAKLDYF
jgi:hypothetical protein